ncbi:hypothetical protein [Haladaptatus halobius]|nr:hypothetical protein [Haladaptatus halobius]
MITLADPRSHRAVYMHKQCGKSHNVIKERTGSTDAVEIICPECGAVETR